MLSYDHLWRPGVPLCRFTGCHGWGVGSMLAKGQEGRQPEEAVFVDCKEKDGRGQRERVGQQATGSVVATSCAVPRSLSASDGGPLGGLGWGRNMVSFVT